MAKASMMPMPKAAPAMKVQPVSLHPNPISDPLHPAHGVMAQNVGRAIGHLMTGNIEGARAHLHDAIDNWLEPHGGSPDMGNDGGSMMPSQSAQQTPTDSAPKRKRKKKA